MTEDIKEQENDRSAALTGERSDRIMNIVIAVLAVLVLAVGGYFGYSYWADQATSQASDLLMRRIEQAKEEVRNNPNDPEARVFLAEALAAADHYDEAFEQLETALEIAPEHIGAHTALGLLAFSDENFAAAEAYMYKVVELTESLEMAATDQRREYAFYTLGRIALLDERNEEAIGLFKESLRIRRDASDTYYFMGQAYRGLGDFDAAIENYVIAVTFDPGYAQAHYALGESYMEIGSVADAARSFRKSADAAPEIDLPFEALAALGTADEWIATNVAAADEGSWENALEAALVARALDPSLAEPVKLHAEALEQLGDPAGALEVYLEAQVLDPDDAEIDAAIERLSAETAETESE